MVQRWWLSSPRWSSLLHQLPRLWAWVREWVSGRGTKIFPLEQETGKLSNGPPLRVNFHSTWMVRHEPIRVIFVSSTRDPVGSLEILFLGRNTLLVPSDWRLIRYLQFHSLNAYNDGFIPLIWQATSNQSWGFQGGFRSVKKNEQLSILWATP